MPYIIGYGKLVELLLVLNRNLPVRAVVVFEIAD